MARKALDKTPKTAPQPAPVDSAKPMTKAAKKALLLGTDNPYGVDLTKFTVVPAEESPKRPPQPDFNWEDFVVLGNNKYFTCERGVNYHSNLLTFKQLANTWAQKLTTKLTEQKIIQPTQKLASRFQNHKDTSDKFLFAFFLVDRDVA